MLRTLFDKITDIQRLSHREIVLSTLTALIALALVAWISKLFLSGTAIPYIVASMGASSVLLFAIPSSPMSRPWALVASHISAAIIGVSCALHIAEPAIALPLAVSLTILAMHYLRCMHPPGGATAALTVLSGPAVQQLGYQFVLTPIILNTLILLLAALALRHLVRLGGEEEANGESPTAWLKKRRPQLHIKPPFEAEDLHSAMKRLDTFIDVKQEALLELYSLANQHHQRRRLGALRCADLMLPEPAAAEYGTSLEEVWHWLERHQISAVPVIDRARHVIGVVSLRDFVKHAETFPQPTLEEKIAALIKPTTELTSDKAEVAGQIMTAPAITATLTEAVADLLPLLERHGIRHIPIIDGQNKLAGMLSRDQIIALLSGEPASDT